VIRGTSRTREGAKLIEGAGYEGAVADPRRLGTLLQHLAGVTVVLWLLARVGDADLHGPRLSSLLEKLVDSGVRGFVYEDGPGADLVRDAGERWRMPVAVAPYNGLAAAVESVLTK
jgi:hypothetical protein